MSVSVASVFAAHTIKPTELKLPAGSVQVSENDRIYAIAEWIVAIGVSRTVFLVSRQRPQPRFPSPMREQLAGYLVGRGVDVIRTDIRFPLQWQKFGSLESTIRYWLNHFLEEGWKRRLFITLPPHVSYPIVLPLAAGAETALNFWQEVLVLMNALLQDAPRAMTTLRPNLWEIAHMWERYWNGTIKHTMNNSNVTHNDWVAIHEADRAWANVIREHLEPFGYVMQSDTVSRLL